MAKRVSKDDFDKEVLQSELPVIVDFYSDSCIPCKQLSPILGDIEDDYEDKAKVVKVNINFDEELMESLKTEHKIVITLEDGVLDGGFGEKIARYFGNSEMKVLNFGAKKEFTDRASIEELYARYHLTPDLIIEDIKACL